MGACLGTSKDPDNIFKVTNINDDQRLVQKGVMEVTPTELIYTDSKTNENWRWPLKYVRNYGCDFDVFSFEAGRKCPGGEGLYAFSVRRARLLRDTVAKNINQTSLQPPPGELPPFPSEAPRPDPNILSFSLRHSSTQSPTHEQPNHANSDTLGRPLAENGAIGLGDSEAPMIQQPSCQNVYVGGESVQQPNYQNVMVGGAGVVVQEPNYQNVHVGGGSVHQVFESVQQPNYQNVMVGGAGAVVQQPNYQNVRVGGGSVHQVFESVQQPNYQNAMVGGAGVVVQQPNYQNVRIGGGSVHQVFESVQQPNYQNVSLPTQNGRSNVDGVIVGDDSQGQYADLQLSNGSSSRMRTTSSTSYMQLDFARHDESPHSSVVPQPSAGGSSSGHKEKAQTPTQLVTPVLEISTSNGHFKENSPSLALPPTTKPPLVDETKVAYGMLDFPVMENLSKLIQEREQEKKQEQDEREQTLATASHSKKKK